MNFHQVKSLQLNFVHRGMSSDTVKKSHIREHCITQKKERNKKFDIYKMSLYFRNASLKRIAFFSESFSLPNILIEILMQPNTFVTIFQGV